MVREWNRFFANGNQKEAGVTILVLDNIDFKIKTVTRDKNGHYIMIKRSIQEEDRTIVHTECKSIFIQKANANSHKKRNQQ